MGADFLADSRYLAAFMVGLMGGVHCLGMCGGIVSALSLSQARLGAPTHSQFPILLGYNAGRIASYTFAGALVSGLTAAAVHQSGLPAMQQALQIIAALFMVLLGLYLAGIWPGLAYLEKGGAVLWRRLEPLGRRFMPVRSVSQAIPLGMVWGWLPCGMVYSVLIWSMSAGSALEGALLMLAFGLGTLPNLLLMGLLANRLGQFVRRPQVRLLAGLTVGALGLYMLWQAIIGT